jgi:hypothetical protein
MFMHEGHNFINAFGSWQSLCARLGPDLTTSCLLMLAAGTYVQLEA